MFLWQSQGYKYQHVDTQEQAEAMVNTFNTTKPSIVVWDTETTGLNIIKDVPFLIGFGFSKYLYTFEPNNIFIDMMYEMMAKPFVSYVFAHNAKFDYHMMTNIGKTVPKNIKLADSMVVARLTNYADSLDSIGLEALGQRLVSEDAKFAGKVIKEHINTINRKRLKEVKDKLKEKLSSKKIGYYWEAWVRRVQFVKHSFEDIFDYIDSIYQKPNYKDSYLEKPDLMKSYLADDLVITLLVLEKLMPVLQHVDKNLNVFKRENELITLVAKMERNGIRADINYLLESRERVLSYKSVKYNSLKTLTGLSFSVGQHQVIKRVFANKYKIGMKKSDLSALEEITEKYEGEAVEVAKIIIELRTIDKWLSTYIEGMLNRIVDGRIYTSINNAGATTGRVTSDLQQQPKEPLISDSGEELFHPRRVFIADEGYDMYYFDYNNMELRVQAYYTLLVSDGDVNLCRAFIPFQCTSIITGETYDIEKDYDNWDTGEWVDENQNPWKPVDLHTVTTLKAFPNITPNDPDFSHYRSLGKRANFLKNYGGGLGAIMTQLKLSEDIAKALNRGYYEAFPKILDYQKWAENQVLQYGYAENLYGRRYYLEQTNFAYKMYNYLIQGSCADLLKENQIKLYKYFEHKKLDSKMLLVVHDEIQFLIKHGEEYIIKDIIHILEDNRKYIPTIPMTAGVEKSKTSWADKEDIHV